MELEDSNPRSLGAIQAFSQQSHDDSDPPL